ncbi:MAG: hypothetical protein DRO11_09190 [Methanobacteriota archaeon]|nr:MAG: hypothetical protein DRO11_09190 [Euryarchaeota archaeon]
MRSKTLALLLVAVIASGIVLAVSAQSQITAADIANAILPGGFINPKAIIPGAITTEHIADNTIDDVDIVDNGIDSTSLAPDSVTDSELANGAVDTNAIQNNAVTAIKLSPNAIANVTNNTAASISGIGTTPVEIATDTISLSRDAYLIITFTGNVTDQSPANRVFINCSISNRTQTPFTYYTCKPSAVTIGDNAVNNVTMSVQFLNQTLKTPAGDHYIRVQAWTNTGTATVKDIMLTVIALPA